MQLPAASPFKNSSYEIIRFQVLLNVNGEHLQLHMSSDDVYSPSFSNIIDVDRESAREMAKCKVNKMFALANNLDFCHVYTHKTVLYEK